MTFVTTAHPCAKWPEPVGEVHLDGRIYYMDGAFSGASASGQVMRGTVGDAGPARIIVPAGTTIGPLELSSEVGAIIPYTGAPPRYVGGEPVADVFWYETFMERLDRDLERRQATAISEPSYVG